jgi:uncharacterized protein GlcG (DUF336 family)
MRAEQTRLADTGCAARMTRNSAHSAAFRKTSPRCDKIVTTQKKGIITMPRQITSLTLADARRIIAAGESKAQDLGIPYNIAVVDAGGGLISHARMDGAWLGSVDISIDKAWTSRAFDMATEDLAKMAQSGKPLFGINSTNHEKVVIFAGGVPVKIGDNVIGAVGASGGTVDQDQKVVEAAVAAFKESDTGAARKRRA